MRFRFGEVVLYIFLTLATCAEKSSLRGTHVFMTDRVTHSVALNVNTAILLEASDQD